MTYSKEVYNVRELTSKYGMILSLILGFGFQALAAIFIISPSNARDCYLAIVLSLVGVSFFILVVVFTIMYGINEYLGGKEND